MPVPYPDTSTSLDWLKQVEEELQKIQACKEGTDCDELELATLLRMAQHDVDCGWPLNPKRQFAVGQRVGDGPMAAGSRPIVPPVCNTAQWEGFVILLGSVRPIGAGSGCRTEMSRWSG